ncbi:hypothetical protein [Saccharibacillus kuerlensis]|uniref:Uncharacterized protein n=1 Tax=Saccharibacillus kuerlensis TaxID=459527 RepID=A0ABQ2LA93_9BACL|nr:hypothetical protein [Saccharibacillus kuerlensis]GGO08258.1 hypothetical protein GCM10010969_37570 [Saccharibacillus kuerlensis]
MEGILLIILFIVNVPLVSLLSRVLFRDKEDMSQAVKDTYTPSWYAALKGRYWSHKMNEAQITLMLGLCAAAIVGEYVLILKLFDWLGITGG